MASDAVKLERLLIGEVSGVDDPANEIPGWMVTKSTAGALDDSLLAEAVAMEAFAKAAASKEPYGNVEYGDSGYQADGKKRYPLDTETHIRAAWSYINQADNAALYSAGDLGKVKAKIMAAMKRIGADVAKDRDDAVSLLTKIKNLLSPPGKEDVDMDKAELITALDERLAPLAEKLEALSKSVEAPAAAAAPTVGETDATASPLEPKTDETALTAADVTKAIEDGLGPVLEIIDKTLDRVAAIEQRFAVRKSLDGQEGGTSTEPSAPTLKDAIGAALKGRSVVVN